MRLRKALILLLTLLLCFPALAETQYITEYQEPYRSQYHFSSATGWIGDPDGYVYYDGTYHLFWWGKATSKDLVHFDQQTIGDTFAITGENILKDFFTGSAVIDKNNTAGFGENSMVAICTIPTAPQKQAIAYSLDDTFNSLHYYEGNPVLEHETAAAFRDPTVFWDEENNRWTMAIALPDDHKIAFYASSDLKTWTYLSEFGQIGAQSSAWECPDLFRMTADDGAEKWVLIVSVGPNLEQYFIGEFDGTQFIPDPEVVDYLLDGKETSVNDRERAFWVDWGPDFYASRTFRDYEGTLTDTVWMGWMGNWTYNNNLLPIRVDGYKNQTGSMSLARTLNLENRDGLYYLTQQPVDALKTLRSEETAACIQTLSEGTSPLPVFAPDENVYELEAVFTPGSEGSVFGLNLLVGKGRSLPICYDAAAQTLSVDRTNCTPEKIEGFPCEMSANIPLEDGKLSLRIFVDKRSVEIFANDGDYVFSLLTFPAEGQTGIEVFASDSGTQLELNAWMLDSIWPGHMQTAPVAMNDTDAAVIYEGQWEYNAKSYMYSDKDCHRITDGSLTATFTGTAVDWYTGIDNEFGIVDIYIDGVLDRPGLDLYSMKAQRVKVYSKTELAPGEHTITIKTTGQKNEKSSGTAFAHDTFLYLPVE